MSAPTRQRSLRERIQSASRGIGISWQGKKSKSYHSKESLAEAQSSESDSATAQDQTETRSTDPDHPVQTDTVTSGETPAETASKDEGPSATEKKALSRTLTQPQGTEQYKVEANDTLAGIAARFDTTPSELAKLNRLSARIVFPGQLLFVPEKRNRAPEATDNQETTDSLAPPQDDRERRPSVTDALRIPYRRPSERSHRFLKVKARHFTDGQGVVAGVLIITPNAVMFDPNVSDPLVIEHGVESYGVIAPLDMLMRAAIYFDIAHMKVQHASVDSESRPKADVYYGRMDEETTKEDEEEEKQKMEEEKKVECSNRFSLEEAPSIEVAPAEEGKPPQNKRSELPATETQHVAQTSNVNAPGPASGDSIDSTDAEVSDAFAQPIEIQVQESTVPSESRRERMLKGLSYPMESITSISRILTSSPKSFVDFSGSLFSGRGSEEETKEEQLPEGTEEKGTATIGYQNLVEEKPEIFETFDKLLQKKPGEEAEGPPLYLCLRMGIPKERKPQASPVLSYGKKRARSEYWFSIPHSRVEDLYNFLQQWIPSLYGDVDDVDPDEAGFIPIDDSLPDDEEEEEQRVDVEEGEREAPRSFLKLVEEHFGFKSISPGDWEVLSLGEMEKIDFSEMELPLPDLLSSSDILQEEHIKELYTRLPARAIGYPWTRIFSTSTDGFLLKTLYRKMMDIDSPVLLAIEDTKGAIFGALLSSPLKQSDSFYGTGESFLYTFYPVFQIFSWTGENDYFVKGNIESVSIGASEGHFGLWLDGDLYRGRSVRCQTYNNEPLASDEDFVVKTLEAWGFA